MAEEPKQPRWQVVRARRRAEGQTAELRRTPMCIAPITQTLIVRPLASLKPDPKETRVQVSPSKLGFFQGVNTVKHPFMTGGTLCAGLVFFALGLSAVSVDRHYSLSELSTKYGGAPNQQCFKVGNCQSHCQYVAAIDKCVTCKATATTITEYFYCQSGQPTDDCQTNTSGMQHCGRRSETNPNPGQSCVKADGTPKCRTPNDNDAHCNDYANVDSSSPCAP